MLSSICCMFSIIVAFDFVIEVSRKRINLAALALRSMELLAFMWLMQGI